MIDFKLSGLGNKTLEETVRSSVEQAGYSELELSDIREPVMYSMNNYLLTVDDIIKKYHEWQLRASLNPGMSTPGKRSIKTIVKKLFAKMFKWYAIPLINSQTRFNIETTMIFSELASQMQIQMNIIAHLQERLKKRGL